MSQKCVLLIEDDATISDLLTYNLRKSGYDVIQEHDGKAGLESALSCPVDLVIADLMLPQLDGMIVSREIARRKPNLPIIMLTARRERETMLEGFEAGADDFVTKPFDLDELMARVAARLRRAAEGAGKRTEGSRVTVGDLVLDLDSYVLRTSTGQVTLNRKECELLGLLLSEPGHLFPREEIVHRVWHQKYMPASRTLDVHVRHLRVKLCDVSAAVTISAVRGVGYRIAELS